VPPASPVREHRGDAHVLARLTGQTIPVRGRCDRAVRRDWAGAALQAGRTLHHRVEQANGIARIVARIQHGPRLMRIEGCATPSSTTVRTRLRLRNAEISCRRARNRTKPPHRLSPLVRPQRGSHILESAIHAARRVYCRGVRDENVLVGCAPLPAPARNVRRGERRGARIASPERCFRASRRRP
jgi:hypothetical protein